MKEKQNLLAKLISHVTDDLEKARTSAVAAAEGATHEESKAEGSKDTRATEASYLARGQTMRVEALEEALILLNRLPLRPFFDHTPIASGAVVCLEDTARRRRWVFLVPAAAGYELRWKQQPIITITPQSPLGRELIEKELGDDVEWETGNSVQQFEIVDLA